MTEFGGILPALVTPFDEKQNFNKSSFAQLLKRSFDGGVRGVYLNGSTGEGFLQSISQRQQVVETAVELSPDDKQIIVHIGALNTTDAVTLARHAADLKVTAVSALPPPGNYNFIEIKKYYETIAAASTVPLIAYHLPISGSLKLSAAELLEVCQIPNVEGLKFTDYDLFTMSVLVEAGIPLFNGYDEVLVAGLLMGAAGGIGTIYNLIPDFFVRLYELAQAEEWTQARQVQRQINKLISIIVKFPVFPATKAILKFSGIDCGYCLPPRQRLTANQETELFNKIQNSSFATILLGENGDYTKFAND
jgi:N-acetylneuraminate lyase